VFGTAALSCGLLTGVSVADSAYTPLVTHTLSPHLTRTAAIFLTAYTQPTLP
jgi:hypothetical protein